MAALLEDNEHKGYYKRSRKRNDNYQDRNNNQNNNNNPNFRNYRSNYNNYNNNVNHNNENNYRPNNCLLYTSRQLSTKDASVVFIKNITSL